MTDLHDPDVGELRQTASHWHGGQSSALYAFASTGTISDPDRLAQEIERCVAEVDANPAAYDDSDGELDRLYELASHAETDLPHYHLGSNIEDYLPEDDVMCLRDPAEALDAYLDMVRSYADDDDAMALEFLAATARGEDYPCGCRDPYNTHAQAQPRRCERDGCDCGGYTPDYGDDAPSMRATVDAVLADDAPELGRDYTILVVDAEGWRHSFWLQSVPEADCELQGAGR